MNIINIITLFLIIFSLQINGQGKYFDEQGKELRSGKFRRLIDYSVNLDVEIKGDWHLIKREMSGQIDFEQLDSIVKAFDVRAMRSDDILIFHYYPGPDRINSTGTTNENWLRTRYNKYLRKLAKKKTRVPRFVYKNRQGLEKYRGIINYIPDKNNIIENTFFKINYPCGSFVVINGKGNYACYFGEYSYDRVIELVDKLNEI